MLPGIPGRDGIVRGSYCWDAPAFFSSSTSVMTDFTPVKEPSKSYASVTEASLSVESKNKNINV